MKSKRQTVGLTLAQSSSDTVDLDSELEIDQLLPLIRTPEVQTALDGPFRTAGSISRLSWEVLAEIFTTCVEERYSDYQSIPEDFSDDSFKIWEPIQNPKNITTVLSSISRQWRKIAIGTSQLWTHLHIQRFDSSTSSEHRTSYIQWLASFIRIWIERSRTQQLDIRMNECGPPFRQAIDLILVPQMERCYRFERYNVFGPCIYTAVPTPVLREALVSVMEGPNPRIGSIFPKSPLLKSLKVVTDSCHFNLFPLRFPHLTYLNLDTGGMVFGVKLDDLLSKLHVCSHSLEMLRLNYIDLDGGSPKSVSLPNLHTLQIQQPMLLLHFTRLDSLENLRWSFVEFNVGELLVIHQVAPCLRHLNIFSSDGHRCDVDERVFILGVNALTELRTLLIDGLKIGSQTLDAFASSEPPICPKLTKLKILRSSSIGTWDFEAMLHERRSRNTADGTPALLIEADMGFEKWDFNQYVTSYSTS